MSKQPEPGKVVFYDKCPPPLLAGEYKLQLSQQMTDAGTSIDAGASAGKKLPARKKFPFKITGPRFTLQPDEIHAAYPPPNSDGPFEARLPCVVLKRRTLPWERKSGQLNGEKLPWLALLLFEEKEVKLLDPPDCTAGGVLNHKPFLWHAGGNLWPPNQLADTMGQQELDKPCLGVEVSKDKFDEVAPTKNELRLLTHVRQVNTQDKELLGQDKDGWFAVVVGNRLPVSGKKYVACLVSLEEQAGILPTSHEVLTTPRATGLGFVVSAELAYRSAVKNYLRDVQAGTVQPAVNISAGSAEHPMAILRRYMGEPSSVSNRAAAHVAAAGDAADVVHEHTGDEVSVTGEVTLMPGQFGFNVTDNVVVIPKPTVRLICLARWTFQCVGKGDFQGLMESLPESGGIGMLGMQPDQTTNADTTPLSKYRVAIDSGHVPLKHLTRAGELKTSFYRGAFTPVGVKRNLNEGPYHDADQARRVDPLTGLENIGYAAAFEIGRLMALADARFALELLKWRRSGHRRVGQFLIGKRIKDRLVNILEAIDVSRFLDDRFLVEALLDRIGPRILTEDLLGPLTDPTGLLDLRDRLPGMDPARVMEALNLKASQVEAMMGVDLGTGLDHSDILGSAGILDEVSIGDSGVLEMGFDTVVSNAATEFGHLEDEHDLMMDQFKGVNFK